MLDTYQIIRPTTLCDFVGNKDVIEQYARFLVSPQNTLLIFGESGCGKTCLSQLLFKELDFDPLVLNVESVQNVRQLKTVLENYLFTFTISECFNKKHKVVFIDDVDIIANHDKTIVSYLSTLIQNRIKGSKSKVVLTCNIREERKFTDLKNAVCKNMVIHLPSDDQVHHYLKCVCGINMDDNRLLQFIRDYGGNIRNILMNLPFAEHEDSISSDPKSSENEPRLCSGDTNVYDTLSKLLVSCSNKKPFSIKEIELRISNDPSLLSLLLYDNYLIDLYKDTNYAVSDVKQVIRTCASAYATASMMESGDMYDSLACYLSFLYRVGVVLHVLSDLLEKNIDRQSRNSDDFSFTTVLNRTALQVLHQKRTAKASTKHYLTPNNLHVLFNVHCVINLSAFIKELDAGTLCTSFNNNFNNFNNFRGNTSSARKR